MSQVPEKSKNYWKIEPKNIFWTQIRSKLPPLVKGSFTNSHIACNRTIDLYCLDVKFQPLGICHSGLSQEETTTFFGSRPILAHFCFSGGQELQSTTSDWAENLVVLIVVQMSFKVFWRTQIFTVTGRAHSLIFWSNFTPIYPLKMVEIKNSHQVIQISQNQDPISFQFWMKTIIDFCAI